MSKISDLSDGGVIQGGDTLIAVRSGGNVKVTYGGSTTANIDGGTIDGTVIGGTTAAAGSFTTGSFTGNVSFGDNDKAIFGAGSDLQIYHDGLNSLIKDVGAGDLNISAGNDLRLQDSSGNNYFKAGEGGASKVYYAGAEKLATTATGIDVTGNTLSDSLTANGSLNGLNAGSVMLDYGGSSVSRLLAVGADATTTGVLKVVSTASDGGPYVEALTVSSTGIDVSGTVSADGLTVDGQGKIQGEFALLDLVETDITDRNTRVITSGGQFRIDTVNDALSSSTKRIMVDHFTGDISFYEDTGTTAKFHWSAADERLGLGLTNPSQLLHLKSSGPDTYIQLGNNTVNAGYIGYNSVGDLNFWTNASTKAMTIDSSSNVGIGTSSPSSYDGNADNLVVGGESAVGLTLASSATTGRGSIYFADGTSGDQKYRGTINYFHSSDDLTITTAATERMRILSDGSCRWTPDGTTQAMTLDASGNLLVGKTSTTFGNAGVENRADGRITSTRSGNTNLLLNRLSSDGDLVQFYKDGAPVGSIGSNPSSYLYIGNGDTTLSFSPASDLIYPTGTSGAQRDGFVSLGNGANRFKDGHFSGNINANTFTAIDGVYLGGVGFANKLDDYEEGTWTVGLSDSAGNTEAQTSESGFYRKIGSVCTVYAQIINMDITGLTSSEDLYVTGLPFEALGTPRGASPVQFNQATNASKMYAQLNASVPGISGSAVLFKINSDSNASSATVVNVSEFVDGASDMFFCITYITT